MSSCSISNKLKFLTSEKLKQSSNEELVDIIVDNANTGFYYDTSEIVSLLEKRIGEEFSPLSFTNYFENRINNMKVFSEHPFFSKDLSELFKDAPTQLNYLNQSFETELIKLTFIDPNAKGDTKLTLNDSQLNEKIQNYKNKLLSDLYDYIVELDPSFKENEFKPLYINGKYQSDNSYTLILDKAADLFKNFDPDISIYKDDEIKVLNIYNSAIILSNFDKMIEKNFKSLLTVNQKNIGALSNPVDTFHYFLEFKGAYTKYWSNDSHESSSAENYSSNLLKTIAKSIPLYDSSGDLVPGQYLGMDRIYHIGAIIKSINKNFTYNIQDNPKKYLKEFLKYLKDNKNIEYYGSIHSLYNYLYGYNSNVANIINKTKLNNPNIANTIIDLEALIAHSINNMSPLVYAKFGVNSDKTILDMVERETKSDEILDFIGRNILSNDSPKSGLDKIDNNLFTNITGLSITPNISKAYRETLSAKTVPIEQVYFKVYQKVLEIKRKNIEDLKEVRRILNSDKDFNSLVSAVIASSLPSAVMNFTDSNGNKIPTIGQSNLAAEFTTSLQIAKTKFKEDANKYFILNNENIIKGTEILLEVEQGNNSKEAIKLNPAENFNLNFIENFVKPLLRNDIPLSFKLVNFSDKSRIYNLAIDQNLQIKETKKSLKDMSNDEIKELSKKSLNNYYSELEKSILHDWGKLVDSSGKKIFSKTPTANEVNEYLSKPNVKLKSVIYNTWKHYNKLGEKFEFVEDIHYSKYSDGLRFNNTIREYLNRSSEKGDINTIFEHNFIKKMFETGVNIPLQNILEPNSLTLTLDKVSDNIEKLKKELNVDLTSWVQNGKLILYKATKGKTTEYIFEPKAYDESKTYELNPLIAKWLHTQNLIRFSYLGVVTGHEFQHPHKIKLSSDNKDFVKELTGRAISMTKRMVILPATQEYFMRGLPESPPEVAKIAIVEDTPAPVWNYTGFKKDIDSMDGAIQATPFFAYLLKHSLPGKFPKNTQKVIGHSFNGNYSTFLKCALFTMTNETIRKSMNSNLSHDEWMKKTHNINISDIDITKLSNGNFIDFGDLASNIYYKIGSEYTRVKGLEKISGNTYKLIYGFTQGKGSEQIESKEVKINNLYDVWQLFGGAYSLEKNNDKYNFSEGSIDIVGKLITMIPELKDKMIHIIAQKSAVKNGAFNINSFSSLQSDSSDELMWGEFDTHFFGVQLDAYHTSDEAMINEVSQVIAALAENQSTPEFYRDLYQAIGKIVGKEIQEYERKFKVNGNYNIPKITEDFIKYITSKDQMGNASEIINSLKRNGINSLPFSNSNFFNQFVISVMSKLKSDFVKRKYPGIACVLNPSYGSIQLFEDSNGVTYFSEDLLKFSTQEDIPTEYSNINDYYKQVLNNVINRKFPNKVITIDKIKPLDRISIIKYGVSELFEENPELALIGSKELYSKYLYSIFPDSKVKDIVYHGTDYIFDKFDKTKFRPNQKGNGLLFSGTITSILKEKGENVEGFYFSKNKTNSYGKIILPVVLNVNKFKDFGKNIETSLGSDIHPYYEQLAIVNQYDLNEYKKKGVDGLVGEVIDVGTEYVVFESEQIHILGSKQDIEKFKEFAKNNNEEINLNDLKNYYEIKNSLNNTDIIERINNKPRDLKPVEITFTQNGLNKNVFDLDAIRLLWAIKDNTLSENDKIILNNFASYFGITDYTDPKSKEYFNDKLKAWVQRTFEMLDSGISYNPVTTKTNFQEYFNGDSLNEVLKEEYKLNTSPIENYIHKSAEVILPKRYRTEFDLENDSFNTISLEKENYFKKKLSKAFTPKTTDCDLYLFSSKGESLYISILDEQFRKSNEFSTQYKEVPIITKQTEDGIFRVDIKGNILYKLPTYKTKEGEVHAKIYEKNGVEYIIFENRIGVFDNVKNFINSSKGKFDIIYSFGANIVTKEEFDELWKISKHYSNGSVYKDLLRQQNILPESDNMLDVLSALTGVNYEGIKLSEYFTNNFNTLKGKLVNQLSRSMYSSWEKSNIVSAARIPSQAMQSFMSMSNKGYIEEESNDVYVSHIQLALQGSKT